MAHIVQNRALPLEPPAPPRRPFDLYREMPEFAEFFMDEPIEALQLLTKAIMQVRRHALAPYLTVRS